MHILWSPEALEDLSSLREYIAQDDPVAARRIALRIIRAVEELLRANPELGRSGRVSGTRELVVGKTPYIVPYRVRDNSLQILRVYHSSQSRPDKF